MLYDLEPNIGFREGDVLSLDTFYHLLSIRDLPSTSCKLLPFNDYFEAVELSLDLLPFQLRSSLDFP
jgi:hypothetical protein